MLEQQTVYEKFLPEREVKKFELIHRQNMEAFQNAETLEDLKRLLIGFIDDVDDALMQLADWHITDIDNLVAAVGNANRNIGKDMATVEQNFKVILSRLEKLEKATGEEVGADE